jgi:flagellar basal body-associated protein FliL
MTYVQNQPFKKPDKINKKLRLILISGLIIAALFGAAVFVYFMILPGQQDKRYFSVVQPAYDQQYTQMKLVYQSFGEPALSSTTTASINKAVTLTDTLGNDNNLTVLPGTQGLNQVHKTSQQAGAVQLYTNDSRTFLVNYLADLKYAGQFQQIEAAPQLATFFKSMNAVDSSTAAPQLLAAAKTASADLNDAITYVNQLDPPIDFQQINDGVATQISNVNNAFTDTMANINGETPEQVTNTIASLNQAAAPLHGLSGGTDINGVFSTSSSLYQEMVKLRAEHPLN